MFSQVLSRMGANDQSVSVDTFSDYTTLWSELIDRGGLYHVNDEVKYSLECIPVLKFHWSCGPLQRTSKSNRKPCMPWACILYKMYNHTQCFM